MIAAGFWLGAGIGLVVGASIGVVVAGLLVAARDADEASYPALSDDVPDLPRADFDDPSLD